MNMIQVKVKIPDALRKQAVKAAADTEAGLKVAGAEVRKSLKAWLTEKNNSEPNRMAGKRTNFWSDVARSVTMPLTNFATSVSVFVTHPAFAQKVRGGVIVPKLKKWLTLPANPLAYGKPAASFKLKFDMAQDPDRGWRWRPALVLAESMPKTKRWKSQKRVDGKTKTVNVRAQYDYGRVMYWLVKRVNQRPWPGSLPPDELLEKAASSGYRQWLTTALN